MTHPLSPLPGYHFFRVKPRGTGFHSFRDPSKISGSLTLFLPPASLTRLPEASCETSTVQVLYGLDQEAFTYRIMHSVALQLSSVEVINNDGNVVSTAHLIQSHTLPRQLQVSNKEANCTLNEGERAFLIRGSKDWGICIGKWEGYVRGVPGTRETRGIPGNPGYLKIKFFSLVETNEWITLHKNNMTNFEIYFPTGTCTVDLRTGEISFPKRVDHVPESIALGFVIAMLHLICQPYQPTATPYNSISLNLSKPRRIDNENMKLVVAAGYYASTIRDDAGGDCSGCGGCGGCGGCSACGSSGCGGDGGGGDEDGDDDGDGGGDSGGSGGGSGGCSGCSAAGCSMGS